VLSGEHGAECESPSILLSISVWRKSARSHPKP